MAAPLRWGKEKCSGNNGVGIHKSGESRSESRERAGPASLPAKGPAKRKSVLGIAVGLGVAFLQVFFSAFCIHPSAFSRFSGSLPHAFLMLSPCIPHAFNTQSPRNPLAFPTHSILFPLPSGTLRGGFAYVFAAVAAPGEKPLSSRNIRKTRNDRDLARLRCSPDRRALFSL